MTGINIGKLVPTAYASLVELNAKVVEAASGSGLDERLIELVKIRTSQLNGCAFCLRLHTRDAIKLGETADRLAVLPAWWESRYFTDLERAVLQLTEQVTLLSNQGKVPDHGADFEGVLTKEQVAAVTWLAIVMNSWNRVAVCSQYAVAP